jgi:ketosteroid isomerase-like protein
MDREAVERWIQGYMKAWGSNDPDDIGRLFTDDARYYTAPHRVPWQGRDGIVEGWLERKDEPGDWSFRYEIIGIAGDMAFVRGWTGYRDDTDYSNLWVIRLHGQGRCSEFTEWWMAIESSATPS